MEAVLSSEIWEGASQKSMCAQRGKWTIVWWGSDGAWRTIISARVDSVCTHFSRAAEGRRTVRKEEEGEGVPPLESWLYRGVCRAVLSGASGRQSWVGKGGRRRLGMIEAQEWWPVLYWLD